MSAVLCIFSCMGIMFFGVMASSIGTAEAGVGAIFAFILLLLGVLCATAAYGLWALLLWGYSLTRVIYIISIPLGFVALLADRTGGNVFLQLVGIGLAIWILTYLAKPEIKRLFYA